MHTPQGPSSHRHPHIAITDLYRRRSPHTKTQPPGPKTHEQAQAVERERESNDSQKPALGPRKANAVTDSSVS